MGGFKRGAKKAELERFLEDIHSNHNSNNILSQAEYLSAMREKLQEYSNGGTKIPERRTYILEKLCEVCGDFRYDDQLLLCDYCDDAYHTFCLNPALTEVPGEKEDWFCKDCIEQKYQIEKEKQKKDNTNNATTCSSTSKVQSLLESYNYSREPKDPLNLSRRSLTNTRITRQQSLNHGVQKCGKCRDLVLCAITKGIKEPSEKCVRCRLVFHQACFNHKKEAILCTQCSNTIIKSIPKTQQLIDQYFNNNLNSKQLKNTEDTSCCSTSDHTQSSQSNERTTRKSNRGRSNLRTESNLDQMTSAVQENNLQNNTNKSTNNLTNNSINKFTKRHKSQIQQLSNSKISDDNQVTVAINGAFSNSLVTSPTGLVKKFKKNDSSALIKINNSYDGSQTQPINNTTINNQQDTVNNYHKSISTQSKSTPSAATSNNKNKNMQFSLPIPSNDPQITIKCRQSLIFALKAKNIEFCDDLSYSDTCPSRSNDANLESHLQVLDIANTMRFYAFKEMTKKGQYVPVAVEEDKIQGFVVRAQEDIKLGTLITEYVGEVDFARNHIFDKQNDSIMDLLRTTRSKTSLVILPNRKGNLGRFLSGINNSSAKSRGKQNVQSMRFNIAGNAHVLLFAKKNIKKGSLLYYDYNAGGYGEYPTQDFI